ncbi:DNA-binding HxlR family transcriptional regulator [Amycolatopsis bartoniae]|uniref:HxlR family transcriptional regulator n=1 Tax=Amycolatopsis bartoniae TaxID=941986 RepID=A0A8H9IY82_9PSEU|nr:helix-turn-helix domain-containing protein [Amycolatopsis bartoniae]MBB2939141.1 DNA-binding HxlR family transcriptional regulator [Amycolatopsis bartoniae]TVT01392.1 helix-turn-helix transcriptional regulator [Amycolatopsis bartoniae]GHF64642.1 HxlR family transcriptional regulator [Amycolatopsis bartoniae]
MSSDVSDLEQDQLVADVFARACSSRTILEHITGRWGTLALVALAEGPVRFNALRRKVDGVSEKMLAQTLQALERDGFVHREAQPTIPPRVEYSLTPSGREAAGKLRELIDFVESKVPEVAAARERYDEAKARQ